MAKQTVVKNFEAGQTTNTPLTPNSNATCSSSGDPNDTTQCAFLYNNLTPYWSPAVSSGNQTATLAADRGNSVVRFMKGLTVTYLAQVNGTYTVTVDGDITDSGSLYTLTGKVLGTFGSKVPPKK